MRWDESNIAIGIKNGNQDAFKRLFLEYYSTICHFLFRVLGDFDVAEDVAQDIFMKVWLRRSALDEKKSVKSLLYVMAKNTALNLLRKKKTLVDESAEDLSIPCDSRADDSILLKELSKSIADCVLSMPAQRKKAFLLSRVEKLSNKEIAELTNLSVRTVEKHLELAIKDIKRKNLT